MRRKKALWMGIFCQTIAIFSLKKEGISTFQKVSIPPCIKDALETGVVQFFFFSKPSIMFGGNGGFGGGFNRYVSLFITLSFKNIKLIILIAAHLVHTHQADLEPLLNHTVLMPLLHHSINLPMDLVVDSEDLNQEDLEDHKEGMVHLLQDMEVHKEDMVRLLQDMEVQVVHKEDMGVLNQDLADHKVMEHLKEGMEDILVVHKQDMGVQVVHKDMEHLKEGMEDHNKEDLEDQANHKEDLEDHNKEGLGDLQGIKAGLEVLKIINLIKVDLKVVTQVVLVGLQQDLARNSH